MRWRRAELQMMCKSSRRASETEGQQRGQREGSRARIRQRSGLDSLHQLPHHLPPEQVLHPSAHALPGLGLLNRLRRGTVAAELACLGLRCVAAAVTRRLAGAAAATWAVVPKRDVRVRQRLAAVRDVLEPRLDRTDDSPEPTRRERARAVVVASRTLSRSITSADPVAPTRIAPALRTG